VGGAQRIQVGAVRAAGHPMADAAPFLRTMAEQAAARLPGAQLAAAFELIPV